MKRKWPYVYRGRSDSDIEKIHRSRVNLRRLTREEIEQCNYQPPYSVEQRSSRKMFEQIQFNFDYEGI